jgi:ubiquitin carboxyl-terminal hydrolase 5/13
VEAATNLPEVEEYNRQEAAKSEDQKKEEERERRAHGIPDPEPVRPLVPLSACINSFCAAERIDGWFSPAVQKNTYCLKERRFTTFPKYLILQMGRFLLSGMELKKLGT